MRRLERPLNSRERSKERMNITLMRRMSCKMMMMMMSGKMKGMIMKVKMRPLMLSRRKRYGMRRKHLYKKVKS